MSNFFYQALKANLNFTAIHYQAVEKGFWPFDIYLKNSISAFKDKETEAKWHPLNEQSYQLSLSQNFFEVQPLTTVEIQSDDLGWYRLDSNDLDSDFEPEFDEPLTIGRGKSRTEVSVSEKTIRKQDSFYEIYLRDQASVLEENEHKITWLGYPIQVKKCDSGFTKNSRVEVNGVSVKFEIISNTQLIFFQLLNPKTDHLSIDSLERAYTTLIQFDESQLPNSAQKTSTGSWQFSANKVPKYNNAKIVDITHRTLEQLLVSQLSHDNKPLNSDDFELVQQGNKALLKAKHSNSPEINLLTSDHLLVSIKVEPEIHESWIQLVEPDNEGNDGRSALDYFFSDNATIRDKCSRNNRDAYQIIKSNSEDKQLLLGIKGEQKRSAIYPKCDVLVAKADVSQLHKQQDAIRTIRDYPHNGNAGLISLFSNKEQYHWPSFKLPDLNAIDWEILTDKSFDGCLEQREFVGKALATPDFAILDGPPGTGKTTAILELIVQLVKQGKRILLTASTHAAINNVLERIDSNSLEKLVYPLRIGDEHNARGVEHYQFDQILEDIKKSTGEKISKQLLVDSANLVCGTTIGIMKIFGDKEIQLPQQEAAFDVMIIDECSKTPFQEFLVPARYAARHILVGDIKQLSPFTDREQIVANLENLFLQPPKGKNPGTTLDKNLQRACFILEDLRDNHGKFSNQLIVPLNTKECVQLEKELTSRKINDQALANVILLQHSNCELLDLWKYNTIFIEKKLLAKIKEFLPTDTIMLEKNWSTSSHAFQNQSLFKRSQSRSERRKNLTSSTEIYAAIMDRLESTSWAEEVCWRLERLYWLRLAASYDKKTQVYKKIIERLLPKSVETEGRVFQLQNIAFPSVLEALSGDGLQRSKQDAEHTLNSGFTDNEKAARHVTLSYQHRMHPDISKYPSNQFYDGKSLKDGQHVKNNRHWDYQRYLVNGKQQHSIWVDVPKETKNAKVSKNSNNAEVKQVVLELEAFAKWAGNNKSNDDIPFTVAILTFYKGQESALRQALRELTKNKQSYSQFKLDELTIKLATVDYFQGQEADLVLLSMVNNERDGFLDSPNRLNVAITRARYQLVIIGDNDYFASKSNSEELRRLAQSNRTLKGTDL